MEGGRGTQNNGIILYIYGERFVRAVIYSIVLILTEECEGASNQCKCNRVILYELLKLKNVL